jgi:predicted DNA-binding transcriptional regulator AlpA
MLTTTKLAIAAILNADPSVDRQKTKTVLSIIEGDEKAVGRPPRILRRPEVARLLGVSVKRVDQLALQGVLKRITLPGFSRCMGYSEEDIRRITESREAR